MLSIRREANLTGDGIMKSSAQQGFTIIELLVTMA
ncbi:MAG: prepilin-type N-terminal cleavage/methylation domain-containing protein, partial [candidate division Zixibacteria bacterium]|nr:prepilin-type N-terminal cleavage/methylation domain-containing protein [candidate division Zixibacteria bacterium]NIW39444.1 prepilin-type N-terminal cleavage/methylation domain-containing protein [candidate division Zixibacteria bacterium]NIX57456.1 prepilin-type N-terminal cleavage/methylation domain-containing protein [candidate division Zixibacteria bacterium]